MVAQELSAHELLSWTKWSFTDYLGMSDKVGIIREERMAFHGLSEQELGKLNYELG